MAKDSDRKTPYLEKILIKKFNKVVYWNLTELQNVIYYYNKKINVILRNEISLNYIIKYSLSTIDWDWILCNPFRSPVAYFVMNRLSRWLGVFIILSSEHQQTIVTSMLKYMIWNRSWKGINRRNVKTKLIKLLSQEMWWMTHTLNNSP